jgi:hypothetical protein
MPDSQEALALLCPIDYTSTMKPQKPVRPPLTIVGIVSNVVALTLVLMLLIQSKHGFEPPPFQLIVDLITKKAKTKKLEPNDLYGLIGDPTVSVPMYDGWKVSWSIRTNEIIFYLSIRINMSISEGTDTDGKYKVEIDYFHVHRSGFKYLFGNVVRALRGGTLFPLSPYPDHNKVTLSFTEPK